MFQPLFHDLLKPQWLAVICELKQSGGMAVGELSKRLDTSYMTVKIHCEDLMEMGYLRRIRMPRKEIGRPEMVYLLTDKANFIFPGIPHDFTIDLLDRIQKTFGETAPERLLNQYFMDRETVWKTQLLKGKSLLYKARLYQKIRLQEGLFLSCEYEENSGQICLTEYHHPLAKVFLRFPRAVEMERGAFEAAIGARVERVEQNHLAQIEFRLVALENNLTSGELF